MRLINQLTLVTSISFLISCGSNSGINAKSVDEIIKNPRIYEGQIISITGKLSTPDDLQKLAGIGATLEGVDKSNKVYLVNFAAKLDYGTKVVVTGEFGTVSLPLVGSFLVLDAKSVEPCSSISAC